MFGDSPFGSVPFASLSEPAAGPRTLVAEAGSYLVTPGVTNLQLQRTLLAEAGSYLVTPGVTNLQLQRTLLAGSGQYTIIGYDATIVTAVFGYGDSEVIFVPWEKSVLAVPADPGYSGETTILYVPSEISSVIVPVEYRTVTAKARLRV